MPRDALAFAAISLSFQALTTYVVIADYLEKKT
jgi:hypothetical protein